MSRTKSWGVKLRNASAGSAPSRQQTLLEARHLKWVTSRTRRASAAGVALAWEVFKGGGGVGIQEKKKLRGGGGTDEVVRGPKGRRTRRVP